MITCEVWAAPEIGGVFQRLPDSAATYNAGRATAMADLVVTWGRETPIDQPEPATCRFRMVDLSGGPSFLAENVRIGNPIQVYARGTIGESDDPVEVGIDGGFETRPLGVEITCATGPSRNLQNLSPTGQVTTSIVSSPVHSGARAMSITLPYKSLGNEPAQAHQRAALLGPDVGGGGQPITLWDHIPTIELDSTWTMRARVRAGVDAEVRAYPYGLENAAVSNPAVGAAIPITGGGPAITHGDLTFRPIEITRTIGDSQLIGYWAGLQILVNLVRWIDATGTWANQPDDTYLQPNVTSPPTRGRSSTPTPPELTAEIVIICHLRGIGAGAIAGRGIYPRWLLDRLTNGALRFNWNLEGNAENLYVTTQLPTGDDEWIAISVDFADANNTIQLVGYTSTDGITWTPRGTASKAAFRPTPDPVDGDLIVGSTPGGSLPFPGRIYSVEMRSGLDPTAGEVLWRFDVDDSSALFNEWVDPHGRTWFMENGGLRRPRSWVDYDGLWIDDLEILAHTATARRSLVFAGKVTDLQALQQIGEGRVGVEITAVDQLGDLMNVYVGDAPWPAETVAARIARLDALAIGGWSPTTIALPLRSFVVSRRDIDRQPLGSLYTTLATGVDGVLWSAYHDTIRRPFLYIEDPMRRVTVGTLDDSTGIVVIVGDPRSETTIDACWLDGDVTWIRDVADVITRVDATWQDQATELPGDPPTERWIPTVVDADAEIEHGQRHLHVTTPLTNQADTIDVAERVLARSRQPEWRGERLVWPLDRIAEDDYSTTQAALDVLDGVSRLGRGIVVTGIADWPVGDTVGMYLDGGEYRFDEFGWTLSLLTTPMGGLGESATWAEMLAAWAWNEMSTGIEWDEMWGVAAPTGGS